MKSTTFKLIGLVALLVGSSAHAAQITETATTGYQDLATGSIHDFSLAPLSFNSSQGTLTGVHVTVDSYLSTVFDVSNYSSSSAVATFLKSSVGEVFYGPVPTNPVIFSESVAANLPSLSLHAATGVLAYSDENGLPIVQSNGIDFVTDYNPALASTYLQAKVDGNGDPVFDSHGHNVFVPFNSAGYNPVTADKQFVFAPGTLNTQSAAIVGHQSSSFDLVTAAEINAFGLSAIGSASPLAFTAQFSGLDILGSGAVNQVFVGGYSQVRADISITYTYTPNGDNNHVTPVPEPEQWAMMMLGLSLLSYTVTRKKAV